MFVEICKWECVECKALGMTIHLNIYTVRSVILHWKTFIVVTKQPVYCIHTGT